MHPKANTGRRLTKGKCRYSPGAAEPVAPFRFGHFSVQDFTKIFMEFHRIVGNCLKSFQINEFIGFPKLSSNFGEILRMLLK